MNVRALGARLGLAVMLTVTAAAPWARAEDPYETVWIRQIGTSVGDCSYGVAVDATGNAWISGYTYGSLGGPSAGAWDAFLAKYDASGNPLWTRQLGTDRGDRSHAVAVDSSGNAWISGYTDGSLGGPNAGLWDAFLAKYDASGNPLWSRQIGTSGYDESYGVAVDGSGNAWICGYTEGSLGGLNVGGQDAFLAKYDASGNLLWTQQLGTGTSDYGRSVAVDAAGNAWISGYTGGSLGGLNAGGQDAFLAKYDASGNLLWTRQLGTGSEDRSNTVAVDAAGNAWISGYTGGSLGGLNAGGQDAFLAKYDASGNLLWTRQLGTGTTDISHGVAVDAAGNAWISGITSGSLGGGNAGGFDTFLTQFDASGDLLWTRQIGTRSSDYSYGVAVDDGGHAWISGLTFGGMGGPYTGYGGDAFLAKLQVPEPGAMALMGLGGLALLRRRKTGCTP